MAQSISTSRWPAYARVPPFLPVPLLRSRCDGWAPLRQARFIGYLAETGCVAEAARRVGMSRMVAYRLRRRPDAASFAHAWDTVLAIRAAAPQSETDARAVAPTNRTGTIERQARGIAKRKVTSDELFALAMDGPFHVTMRRGRFISAVRKPSVSALLRHVRRLDRIAASLREAA